MNAKKNALKFLSNLHALALNVMYEDVKVEDVGYFIPFYSFHIDRIGKERKRYSMLLYDVMCDFFAYTSEIKKHDVENDFIARHRCFVAFRNFIAETEDEIMKGGKR